MTPSAYARQLNAYHHNNSLLFQFILAEFIEAYEAVQEIDFLCNTKSTTVPTTRLIRRALESKKQLDLVFQRLISREEMAITLAWNLNEGVLTKLKRYCALFVSNADKEEKELLGMQHYIEKIWNGFAQAREIFTDEEKEREQFLSVIEKSSASMHRLAKLIVKIIHQFRDDENVLLFIVRNKVRLDKVFGSGFTAKTLTKMFPKGLREAQHFLCKKYALRGFDSMEPIILNHFAEIESSSS